MSTQNKRRRRRKRQTGRDRQTKTGRHTGRQEGKGKQTNAGRHTDKQSFETTRTLPSVPRSGWCVPWSCHSRALSVWSLQLWSGLSWRDFEVLVLPPML